MSKKQSKPKQLPIYRATERLLSWAMPIVDSLPKSLACQTLGGLLVRDLRDCLTAILIANDATDTTAKVEAIKLLIANLTGIQTVMRTFAEQRKISLKQEADFLDLVNPISSQAINWLAKWEYEVTVAVQS